MARNGKRGIEECRKLMIDGATRVALGDHHARGDLSIKELARAHTHTHTYIYIRTYTYTYTYMYTHTYMYININMHIHTQTLDFSAL